VTTLTLLHNPHCSTSVHALDALEGAGHDVTVRRYLLVAERLSEAELRSLAYRLEGDRRAPVAAPAPDPRRRHRGDDRPPPLARGCVGRSGPRGLSR
jgi:hypothetical protein